MSTPTMDWHHAGMVSDFPENAGACALVAGRRIAIFRDTRHSRWFAGDDMCPHWQEQVLSRGLLAFDGGEPKVACPLHKRKFSLETGACLSGDVGAIGVYPVDIRDGNVFVGIAVAQTEAA